MAVGKGATEVRETDERGTAGLRSPLRRATKEDGRALAELIELAGEGIPGYLWSQEAKEGQTPIEVGTERVSRDDANFSYRNAVVA